MAPERDIYAVLLDIKEDVGKLHEGQNNLRRDVTTVVKRIQKDATEGCSVSRDNRKAIGKLDIKVGRIAIAVIVLGCAVFGIDKLIDVL